MIERSGLPAHIQREVDALKQRIDDLQTRADEMVAITDVWAVSATHELPMQPGQRIRFLIRRAEGETDPHSVHHRAIDVEIDRTVTGKPFLRVETSRRLAMAIEPESHHILHIYPEERA